MRHGAAIPVGRQSSETGTGRIIPLNPRALAALVHWRAQFPQAPTEHCVFPQEKYRLARNDWQPCAWEIKPAETMHRSKVAWENARRASGVGCRFHDLRYTFISPLAESQPSDSTIMPLARHVSRTMNHLRRFHTSDSLEPGPRDHILEKTRPD